MEELKAFIVSYEGKVMVVQSKSKSSLKKALHKDAVIVEEIDNGHKR